jgi:hypothetical protein
VVHPRTGTAIVRRPGQAHHITLPKERRIIHLPPDAARVILAVRDATHAAAIGRRHHDFTAGAMELTQSSLRAGDRVRIVTGGPTMAVSCIQWNAVRCVLTVDGIEHFAYFLPQLLVIAEDDSARSLAHA